MWVPKTPVENEKSLKKEALGDAVAYAGFLFVLLLLTLKIGLRKGMTMHAPVPWSELPSHVPMVLGFSVVTLVLTYFFQKANIRRTRSRAFVCLGCGKECRETKIPSCQCGGPCADLNGAKWADAGPDE